mmetsp:Transcript_1714/g.2524  ORF Transcript_1714/g.2524 Transcript_1714/m.2524 type:complete len:1280 (+) Transcript_1714:278-4117(+)
MSKEEGGPMTSTGEEKATAIPSSSGRVVRLNFACRASLPLGSFLRVTGSTLWAPGTVTVSDPSDAQAVATEMSDEAFHSNGSLGIGGTNVDNEESVNSVFYNPNAGLYASSVEMVTTPETYPVWRTRTPVVVVLGGDGQQHQGSGGDGEKPLNVHHHRYRYMIVNPGADVDHYDDDDDEDGNNAGSNKAEKAAHHGQEGGGASTSNDAEGSHAVTLWENPFEATTPGSGGKDLKDSRLSMASLRSIRTSGVSNVRNLANLPYRTLDIDMSTATVIDSFSSPTAGADVMEEEKQEHTEDGVRIDTWDFEDDLTFRPYVVREALIKKTKIISRMESDITDMSETGSDGASSGLLNPDSADSGAGSGNDPSRRRIFFVCYHLPVIVTRDPVSQQWNACWSESLLAKTEGSHILQYMDAHWIGTVSTNPHITDEKDKEAIRQVLAKMNCTPLFFDKDIQDAYYLGMCKQVLWPAFHNIDSVDFVRSGHMDPRDIPTNLPDDMSSDSTSGNVSDWNQGRLVGWWRAYQHVNKAFADMMASTLRPHDTMWVHDYHLSLLPKMVADYERAKFNANVIRKVYFLHIPFPTSKIFRELECGDAILEGILNADLIGFHTFDHARHFLNSAKRILGLNYESLVGGLIGVKYHGNTVLVTMSNVSIEPTLVDSMLELESVSAGADALRKKHEGRSIICGVDIAQHLSGIKYKFLAYERFLTDYPVWKPKVALVQRCLIPGSRRIDEASTIRELRALVRRIQDKFGTEVIDYEELGGTSIPMDRRLSLWLASDVLFSTPIREGLNLLPLEYVFVKKAPATPGVVIASEFAAVNSILNGALRANPYDLQSTATSIDKALTMDMSERKGRRSRDIEFVSSSPSDKWTQNVLRDLSDVTTGGGLGDDDASDDASGLQRNSLKFSKAIENVATFLARESSRAFTHLDTNAVIQAYNSTKKRAIILDFNGTIVIKEAAGKYLKREILGTSGFKPPVGVIKALTKLCEDPNNVVYVVSGDAQENVETAIGHIPGLGLAASNGVCFSPPSEGGRAQRKWHEFDLGVDWNEVKKVVLPVMSKYTARTNGSFIKLTHSSIGWSYYSCDPEWGALQASHLVLELEKDLRAFDVRFVTLKGVIELVPRRLNKGLIVKKVLRDVAARNGGGKSGVDFILCMGDDISDEKMFTSVFSFLAEMEEDPKNVIPSPHVCGDDAHVISTLGNVVHDGDAFMEEATPTRKTEYASTYAFTAAVGKKATHASQYVYDATDVADLLVSLSSVDMASEEMCWNNEDTSGVLFA